MNDLARGALEALAWVLTVAESVDPSNPHTWSRFLGEVESVKDDILRGVAVDFRLRVKMVR